MTTIDRRVAAGADWLDELMPGWASKIDLGRLDLEGSCCCVLGQLSVDYADINLEDEDAVNAALDRGTVGYWAWVDGQLGLPRPDAKALGFNTESSAEYLELTETWFELIEARQLGVTP